MEFGDIYPAKSHLNQNISIIHKKNENEKKRSYNNGTWFIYHWRKPTQEPWLFFDYAFITGK